MQKSRKVFRRWGCSNPKRNSLKPTGAVYRFVEEESPIISVITEIFFPNDLIFGILIPGTTKNNVISEASL